MQQRINDFSDEELIEQYNKLSHLGKLSEHFGVPHIQIWRRCQKLNLKFRNGGYTPPILLAEILEGKHGYYPTGKLKKRLIKEKILDYRCAICNISEWNNSHIVLELDHINGVSTDHKLDNLRLLCPNCHSQTETYCGRNMGSKSKV